MTGKTHQIIGLTAGLATYLATSPVAYNPATFGAVAVLSSLGALLPDIDSPAGMIWSYLPFGRTAGELVNPFLQHRNITHSLLGFGLVGLGVHALLAHVPVYWGIHTAAVFISFMVAYGSHIVADMVTVEGVPLLFPYQRMYGIPPRPFEGVRIVTGKWFENLVVFPLANLSLIWLLWASWPNIRQILFRS